MTFLSKRVHRVCFGDFPLTGLSENKKESSTNRRRVSIASSLKMEGIGLHSGEKTRLRMEPAPFGTGIVFRSQNKEKGDIPLSPFAVVDTLNAVSLSNGRWSAQTIEHFLAALRAAEITDLYVILEEAGLDGRIELPILDGSACLWYEAIMETGLEHSDEELLPLRLHTAVWVVEGDKYLIALPQEYLSVHYSIDYKHPLLEKQSLCIDLEEGSKIAKEILPARTFGFLEDVENMKAQGLIRGGALDNALVLTKEGYANESLRFSDECLRHKILDLLGDMYLLGRPLQAHLIASKAGHALDVTLAQKILGHVEGDELKQRRLGSLP